MTDQEIFVYVVIIGELGFIIGHLIGLVKHVKGLKYVIEREAKRIINDSQENIR